MKLHKSIFISLFALALCFIPLKNVFAGGFEPQETDNDQNEYIASFFDLRERETFIQSTITANSPITLHIQIFNVANNCNENNFFDAYTGNDTHIYNMRDIITNDGNPSGVVLPDGAYGIVIISNIVDGTIAKGNLIGNFRIIDNAGYEYRTNSPAFPNEGTGTNPNGELTFNFNTVAGVTLSDVVGITVDFCENTHVCAANILENFLTYDIDIFNNNEIPFSCRDVIFACVDQDSPLLEELLSTESGTFDDPNASVASFDYGINNAIPHSKGGELLCPGNTISEGFVRMALQGGGNSTGELYFFVGLNNGNGRGSMDHVWNTSKFFIVE